MIVSRQQTSDAAPPRAKHTGTCRVWLIHVLHSLNNPFLCLFVDTRVLRLFWNMCALVISARTAIGQCTNTLCEYIYFSLFGGDHHNISLSLGLFCWPLYNIYRACTHCICCNYKTVETSDNAVYGSQSYSSKCIVLQCSVFNNGLKNTTKYYILFRHCYKAMSNKDFAWLLSYSSWST